MPRLVNSCANIRLFLIYALSLYKKFQEKGKKMIVYNTTFHIHKDIVDECLEYLKNSYIPKASESGILYSPYLRRILIRGMRKVKVFPYSFIRGISIR